MWNYQTALPQHQVTNILPVSQDLSSWPRQALSGSRAPLRSSLVASEYLCTLKEKEKPQTAALAGNKPESTIMVT